MVAWVPVLALCARVDLPVPGSPVPISLQTLGLVLGGLLLGPWRGGLAVGMYLLAGAVGLPVLADGEGGLAVMVGPSVGYLLGFPLCAVVAGALRGGLGRDVGAGLLGQAVVLLLGVGGLVLGFGVAPAEAVATGALPFLPGMVAKALAAALLAAGWRRLRRA